MSTPGESSTKRRYDGSGRRRDATERQERIIDAAHTRFLRDGYGATSIEQIARDAGTSTQTVYAAFTNKAGILRRVVDVAVAGDHEEIALIDRPDPQAIFTAPDSAAAPGAGDRCRRERPFPQRPPDCPDAVTGRWRPCGAPARRRPRPAGPDRRRAFPRDGRRRPACRPADVPPRRRHAADHRSAQLAPARQRARLDRGRMAHVGTRIDASPRDGAVERTRSAERTW